MKSGLTVLSPMHRGMKTTPLEQQQCRCGDTHDLVLRGGQPHEIDVTDRGERLLTPCPRGRILRRANSDGTYRWYQEIAASCGTLKMIRIDITEDDRRRGFKRSEHFRQHVPTPRGDSLYDRCYGWREDAESCHNTLDRTLYGGRMIAHDTSGQLLVMIGFAAGRNSIAEYLHHRDQRICLPAAA